MEYLQVSLKYRRRLQDVLDCRPPTAAKKPPTLTSTLLQQAVQCSSNRETSRWKKVLCWIGNGGSAYPGVPLKCRRQNAAKSNLDFIWQALKGRQPLSKPLLES